ncbi:MAG: hypothetical protein ACI38U_04145 [Corynebacterium sp.]|uniref:hypothetical protein n=1 Tax=Corynebacterium sp. TaxID=1720 RepID=UPI003F0A88C8
MSALNLAETDASGAIDRNVLVEATINRAHQQGTTVPHPDQYAAGCFELQKICRSAKPSLTVKGSAVRVTG